MHWLQSIIMQDLSIRHPHYLQLELRRVLDTFRLMAMEVDSVRLHLVIRGAIDHLLIHVRTSLIILITKGGYQRHLQIEMI